MPAPASPLRERRLRAIAGSALFFVVAPGVAAGLVPALIAGWERDAELPAAVRAVGAVLAAGGVVVLVQAFARFAVDGVGTPAPVAPTETLVVSGLYRRVRNPMYLAVLAVVAGQALLLGSAGLAVYGAGLGAAFVAFVRLYEEPTLGATYGARYDAYRAAVPGWIPRLRPPNVPEDPS